ncbi:hypothetical protein CR513_44171, partial [Mucuna pruriens]
MEDWMKQMSEYNMQFQQNLTATIHDLKMQVGQLVDTISQMQLASYGNITSPTILNPKGGGLGVVTLQSADVETEPRVDSRVQKPARSVPLPFPTQIVSARRFETNEDLLKLFRKVEINIQLLDAIKQFPKYAKFLKELCVHERKKMKGAVEVEGIVSALIKHEDANAGVQRIFLKKYQDPCIFSVPCTIDNYTFTDAMLDLRASINIMPASVYRSLNFGDLELIGMVIQLANRSVVQPLGMLEDVLVQVNKLIFLADFYVLDMEDEAFGKGSTLILGQPFLMTVRRNIDVYTRTFSMEFGDTFVKFNIFEALKHPAEDHSIFTLTPLIGSLNSTCE